MQTADLQRRIAAVKHEHDRGFYLDALQLERDLLLALISEAHCLAWEHPAGGKTDRFVQQLRIAHRELTGP